MEAFWSFQLPEKNPNCSNMRLRLFKPLFKLFNLSKSHISLNSCRVEVDQVEVEVLKNREHLLGKVVLKEAPLTHTTHLNKLNER